MKTDVLKIDPNSPQPLKIKKVAGLLQKGGIVAIPTETVYGLAANTENQEALDRLYTIKKRPKDKPFTIQIANFSQLKNYLSDISPKLEIILKEFWPGGLTVIINGIKGKVGLRMPDNKVALSIIDETKVPLAVTSANLSGEKPAFSAEEAVKIFNESIDLVVDGGKITQGVESTVLDCTVSPFKILRTGSVSDRLDRFLRLYG